MKRQTPKKKNPSEQQTDFMKVYDVIIAHFQHIKQVLPPVTMGGKHV